jgi:hypothetical protein
MMKIKVCVSQGYPNSLEIIQVWFRCDHGLRTLLVSKYILHIQSNLITILAEIEVFLNGLTLGSIDRAILAFKEGIKSRTILPPDFDPRRAQLACSRILRLTEKNSTAINNVYDIPKFWINLNGLKHSANLNIIESYITRTYCMQGALNFHLWLVDIVQQAVKSTSRHTWIEKLAWDVEMAVNQKRKLDFDSVNYLSNLTFHSRYSYTPGQFRFEQTELVSTTLSSILRLWLHFPSDELSLLQLSLINIVASKSPSSILFLDKIWEMYSTPFSTVFNVWVSRSSKANIEKSLVEFQQQFHSHPFATAGSLEYQKLEYLSKLISEWMGINSPDSGMPVMVRRNQECSLSSNNLLFQHAMIAGPGCKPAGAEHRSGRIRLTEHFPTLFYNCE